MWEQIVQIKTTLSQIKLWLIPTDTVKIACRNDNNQWRIQHFQDWEGGSGSHPL